MASTSDHARVSPISWHLLCVATLSFHPLTTGKRKNSRRHSKSLCTFPNAGRNVIGVKVKMTGMGDGRAKMNEVWHVRHGEKCVEVEGVERQAWKKSPRFKRVGYFDTFITCHGHVQASSAGMYIKSLPFYKQQPGCFDIVYTSPLVRAVQTAVCVSQALGNLPLQVVPGLASCTEALEKIGPSALENLMTDAEITKTFPWITVVPRDPLAPTTFPEAAEWLAAKACEKEGTADSSGGVEGEGSGSRLVSRVLAVGHQEGTKVMSSSDKVPTPHCCIGVFKAEASEDTYAYELLDLLSHKGESIKPGGGEPSSYACRPAVSTPSAEENGLQNGANDAAAGEDVYDGAVKAAAERVIALTVSTEDGVIPMF